MGAGERVRVADERGVPRESGQPTENLVRIPRPARYVDTERVWSRRRQMDDEDVADVEAAEHRIGGDAGGPRTPRPVAIPSPLQERDERRMPAPIKRGRLHDPGERNLPRQRLL